MSGRPGVSETSTTMLFEKPRTALLDVTLTVPGQSGQVAIPFFSVMTKAMGCFALAAFFFTSSSWARLWEPLGMSKAEAPVRRPRAAARARETFIMEK